MKNICKRCMLFDTDTTNLQIKIQNYIDSLDKDTKVDEKMYRERLKHCEDCPDLMNGICKHCGCFVLVRAIKKNQYCPYPPKCKW